MDTRQLSVDVTPVSANIGLLSMDSRRASTDARRLSLYIRPRSTDLRQMAAAIRLWATDVRLWATAMSLSATDISLLAADIRPLYGRLHPSLGGWQRIPAGRSAGDTWVILRWNPPVDGGAVGFYRIQRKREGSPWEDAGTSTETAQLMSNQPRGVELLYRVIAVNKAGVGQPSATVTVVL
ncbi:MAG: fibronectin type III domain-containing protein [Gemmatimonadetes bacterium]|nr:fibronectin type III domain-containing protein [Gemmatimonadota bacterium]